jgi:hypothetical protein
MALGIQLAGIIFSLFMIYLSYTYYRKNSYSWRSFIVWGIVWAGVMVIIAIPQTIYGVMQALDINRTADFFVAIGFGMFAVLMFYLYVTVKQNDRRVERIVRALAYRAAEQQEKTKKKNATKTTRKRTQ